MRLPPQNSPQATPAGTALEREHAAVPQRDRPGDRESEPRSGLRAAAAPAHEALAQSWQLVVGDARPVVHDGNDEGLLVETRRDRDLSARLRVADRVLHQVGDRLAK